MIAINKEEKEVVSKRFPNLCIVRTMKQDSKRHHYYMEERRDAMQVINKMRGLVKDTPKNKNNWRGNSYNRGNA